MEDTLRKIEAVLAKAIEDAKKELNDLDYEEQKSRYLSCWGRLTGLTQLLWNLEREVPEFAKVVEQALAVRDK